MKSKQDVPRRPARHGRLAPGLVATLVVAVAGLAAVTQAGPVQAGPVQAGPDQGVSLQGRVLDPEDRPVTDARVVATRPSVVRTVSTAEDGTFALQDLEPGTWRLQVTAPGFEPIRRTLTLAADPDDPGLLELRLTVAELHQEIVVTSELPELGADLVLTADRLAETASEDLVLSLRSQPGLSANRRGPINLEPTVRGLQETQVGMFVDGTRTFAAGPGRMDSDLSHVSPHAVESVRVVKGPYALTWGAGTLSALEVRTFTPEPTAGSFEMDGRVQVIYGNNADVSDGFAGVWGGDDRYTFSVLHNHRRGGDYEDGGGRTVPGDFRTDDTRWTLGWSAGDRGVLRYSGGYQGQDDLDYPGRILDATFFKTRSHAVELQWWPEGGGVAEVVAQAYVNRKDHRMNNDEKPTAQPDPNRVPPFAVDVDLETESNTAGGRVHLRFDRETWSWKLGGDFYRSEQNADRTIARRSDGRVLFEDVVWPDARIDDLGIYGQGLYGGDGYRLGATVRVDRIESTAGRASEFFLANTSGELDREDVEISAALSGRVRLGADVILTAGVGRAVRAPNASERYSDRFPATKFQLPAEFLGNPGLDPERSLEVDLGAEAALGSLVVDVDLFWREIDDYITIQPDPSVPRRLPMSPPVVFRTINGTSATFYGGELELRQPVGEWLSWRGSLSWIRGQDELFDEPVLGIPPLTTRLALRLDPPRRTWWAEIEAAVVDRQDRVAVVRFEVPTAGYTVFDLRGGVRFARRWELRAGVENLTEKDYAVHLNAKNPFTGERIREPGRNVFLGLGLDF